MSIIACIHLPVVVCVETLADGYHKKIPLPRVLSIAQAQAHSAQVQLHRTMIAGPRHKHIRRGTTPTVPTAKRLTLTTVPTAKRLTLTG